MRLEVGAVSSKPLLGPLHPTSPVLGLVPWLYGCSAEPRPRSVWVGPTALRLVPLRCVVLATLHPPVWQDVCSLILDNAPLEKPSETGDGDCDVQRLSRVTRKATSQWRQRAPGDMAISLNPEGQGRLNGPCRPRPCSPGTRRTEKRP